MVRTRRKTSGFRFWNPCQHLVNVFRAPLRGADNRRQRQPSLRKIISKPVHLVHPLVQDGHDADVPVRQPSPVHEMMRVPEEEAVDAELGRDRARRDAMAVDLVERCKEVSDVPFRLLGAPAVACVSVNLVKPQRCGLLDANGHVSPGSGR